MDKLSTRLEMIASLVPNGVNCADIGADHGYLIIELFNRGIINNGYACENKLGPYTRLKNNIIKVGLLDKIVPELSSGIRTLPNDINAVIIAGMGGDTVCDIINESINKLDQIDYFIISSHSKMEDVRRLLTLKNYYIDNEKSCYDMDQFYEVSIFKKGYQNYSSLELKYGPHLLKNKDYNLIKKIQEKLIFNQKLIKNENIPSNRIHEIDAENNELIHVLELLK